MLDCFRRMQWFSNFLDLKCLTKLDNVAISMIVVYVTLYKHNNQTRYLALNLNKLMIF